MNNPAIADLLAKRRDRAIASILGVKERECDRFIPPEAGAKLRKVVLDQLNEFTDLTLDVMRSLDSGGVMINEIWLEKIDEIHSVVTHGR